MNRRNFLRNTSVAGLAATTIASTTFQATAKTTSENLEENFKDDFELNEVTIDELQQKMKDGKTTSKAITKMYLKRIEKIDKNGPAQIGRAHV